MSLSLGLCGSIQDSFSVDENEIKVYFRTVIVRKSSFCNKLLVL